MSCYISNGILQGQCDTGTGSIKKLYVVGNSDQGLTGFTYDADDQITGATSESGTTLYGVNLRRGVSSLTQTITKSYENGTLFFDQALAISLYKYDNDKRTFINTLALNDELQIIAIDQNDVQYMVGEINGLSLGGTATTGTALGDKNGFDLVFNGQEPIPARVIDGDLATVFADASIVE